MLPLIPDFISSYIDRWAFKRLPEPNYKASIIRQRLYILPTRHGVTFFLVIILVLTGAINYENSLAFMLSFLLASICFLSMIYCHQNINNLDAISSTSKPVFVGQSALFPVTIKTKSKQSHLSICLETDSTNTTRCNLLEDQDSSAIMIAVPALSRGYLSLGKIKIYTQFPLGLFHAWSWLHLKSRCLIYPKPEKYPLQLSHSSYSQGNNQQLQSGYDDFSGIREYQKEDPPKHLAWKAIAKTGILQTKQFHGNTGNEVYLNWFDLPGKTNTERHLSILCYWIINAEKQGIKYGLILPDLKIKPDSGLSHYQNCLKHLAVFKK